jgi:hypothetical protein
MFRCFRSYPPSTGGQALGIPTVHIFFDDQKGSMPSCAAAAAASKAAAAAAAAAAATAASTAAAALPGSLRKKAGSRLHLNGRGTTSLYRAVVDVLMWYVRILYCVRI